MSRSGSHPWLLNAALLKPFTGHVLLQSVNRVLQAGEIPRKSDEE